MEIKTTVLWSLVNGREHGSLKREADLKIENLIPLADTLFPGITYYSLTGFSQVMHQCVIPTLRKRYPDLVGISAADVSETETNQITTPMLASNRYEWQDSDEWRSKFKMLLAA